MFHAAHSAALDNGVRPLASGWYQQPYSVGQSRALLVKDSVYDDLKMRIVLH